jgi:hypothetical protein
MTPVARLVTWVDVDDRSAHPGQVSISARHEAVLVDGRCVLLLADRGWSSSLLTAGGDAGSARAAAPDIWASMSVEEIDETARVVVGPDEPASGRSQEDAEADHWSYLDDILGQNGVVADAVELRRLPHDVVLSERLLARVGRGRDLDVPP